MSPTSQHESLGRELARLECRTRFASGCDMGNLAIGYYVAPVFLGLIAAAVLFAVQSEGDVLSKLGLLNFMPASAVYMFAFLATSIGLYGFIFSAPNCPIIICEDGIEHKRRQLLYSDMIGVRSGSGEVEGPEFSISVTPVGRLANAMNNLDTARQNVVSCSIHVMKTNYEEVTIPKALVMYRQADLEKLFETIGEKVQQQTGLACSAG